jgi:hypothetical protein
MDKFSTLTTYVELQSYLIENNLTPDLCNLASSILEKIVLGELHSVHGIVASLDKPTGCKEHMPNLVRPAVLRQHYGLNLHNGTRCSYGDGTGSSTVGRPITRDMTEEMIILANEIQNKLKHVPDFTTSFGNISFNHCTVLLYYHKNKKSPNNLLGFHTDIVYSRVTGEYIPSKNSQTEGTPTCIVTIGGSRNLCFQKQTEIYDSEKKTLKWGEQKKTFITLGHNSLFVLHPYDEKPLMVKGEKRRWRHGIPEFANKDNLSMALVFRSVKNRTSTTNVSMDCQLTPTQEKESQLSHQRLQALFRNFIATRIKGH